MRYTSKRNVSCPYNQNHYMPENTLLWHLNKCPDRKKLAHVFAVCPYNAMHHVPKHMFEAHKRECKDRVEDYNDSKEYDYWDVQEQPKPSFRSCEQQSLPDSNAVYIPEPIHEPDYDSYKLDKMKKNLRKKLTEIKKLQEKVKQGYILNQEQEIKLNRRADLELELNNLEMLS